MMVEITDIPKDVELNKWHRVYELDGERKVGLYVRFIFARDRAGNKLYKLPKGQTAIVKIEYNGIHYP